MEIIVPGPTESGGVLCTYGELPASFFVPGEEDWELIQPMALRMYVPHEVASRLMARARRLSTYECYNTRQTFQRGMLKRTDQRWEPRPEHLEFLVGVAKAAGIDYTSILQLDNSIHFKRAKGVTRGHPELAGQNIDVIFLISMSRDDPAALQSGMWYNVTSLSITKGTDAMKPTDDKWTCFCCGNKSSAREEKNKFKACKRCRATHYCSFACHKLDWPIHAKECKKWEAVKD